MNYKHSQVSYSKGRYPLSVRPSTFSNDISSELQVLLLPNFIIKHLKAGCGTTNNIVFIQIPLVLLLLRQPKLTSVGGIKKLHLFLFISLQIF